eukprot:TRINITY_DN17173_c0_g1_i1.p1 TRINITY_DN17173_c0_g1~~TRINITY_DN17173_c0_g1_i1.p1  ORF type:complete len:709 (+),score=266.15 TRINITY_DN17173_c0_g1_i1:64-2127(+)
MPVCFPRMAEGDVFRFAASTMGGWGKRAAASPPAPAPPAPAPPPAAAAPAPAPAAAVDPANIISELQHLADLWERGSIAEPEFLQAKEKLMSGAPKMTADAVGGAVQFLWDSLGAGEITRAEYDRAKADCLSAAGISAKAVTAESGLVVMESLKAMRDCGEITAEEAQSALEDVADGTAKSLSPAAAADALWHLRDKPEAAALRSAIVRSCTGARATHVLFQLHGIPAAAGSKCYADAKAEILRGREVGPQHVAGLLSRLWRLVEAEELRPTAFDKLKADILRSHNLLPSQQSAEGVASQMRCLERLYLEKHVPEADYLLAMRDLASCGGAVGGRVPGTADAVKCRAALRRLSGAGVLSPDVSTRIAARIGDLAEAAAATGPSPNGVDDPAAALARLRARGVLNSDVADRCEEHVRRCAGDVSPPLRPKRVAPPANRRPPTRWAQGDDDEGFDLPRAQTADAVALQRGKDVGKSIALLQLWNQVRAGEVRRSEFEILKRELLYGGPAPGPNAPRTSASADSTAQRRTQTLTSSEPAAAQNNARLEQMRGFAGADNSPAFPRTSTAPVAGGAPPANAARGGAPRAAAPAAAVVSLFRRLRAGEITFAEFTEQKGRLLAGAAEVPSYQQPITRDIPPRSANGGAWQPPPARPPVPAVISSLRRLAEQRRSGVLSEAAFAAKKRALLDGS